MTGHKPDLFLFSSGKFGSRIERGELKLQKAGE